MGIRIKMVQKKCPKCGYIFNERGLYYLPIFLHDKFGKLISECPKCKTKCINSKNEIFLMSKKDTKNIFLNIFLKQLILSILLMCFIFPEAFYNVFSLYIYSILFLVSFILISLLRYFLYKKNSYSRLNDTEYVVDLVLNNILSMNKLSELYKNNYISKDTIDYIDDLKNNYL